MKVANKLAYTQTPDNLIYDFKHPIDAENVELSISAAEDGTVKRGQVIDLNLDTGAYALHTGAGTPSVICAEDVPYVAGASTLVVPAFTSGSFRLSELVMSSSLSAVMVEGLREKGIFLK